MNLFCRTIIHTYYEESSKCFVKFTPIADSVTVRRLNLSRNMWGKKKKEWQRYSALKFSSDVRVISGNSYYFAGFVPQKRKRKIIKRDYYTVFSEGKRKIAVAFVSFRDNLSSTSSLPFSFSHVLEMWQRMMNLLLLSWNELWSE